MCTPDALSIQLLGLMLEDLEGALVFDPITNVDDTKWSVQDDNRYFETVYEKGGAIYVRVSGNVILIDETGTQTVVPQGEFFEDPYKPFFDADIYRLSQDNRGAWKICSGLIGW